MFAQTHSKSFDQTFSKVCAVEGAQPSSLSAESEIFLTALFFLRMQTCGSNLRRACEPFFILRLHGQKKK
jgi:hypothetical protein